MSRDDQDANHIEATGSGAVASDGVLAAVAPGHLKATKTTVPFSVEQAMGAMTKAGSIVYPAPGIGQSLPPSAHRMGQHPPLLALCCLTLLVCAGWQTDR
jgi:hypothetical protein